MILTEYLAMVATNVMGPVFVVCTDFVFAKETICLKDSDNKPYFMLMMMMMMMTMMIDTETTLSQHITVGRITNWFQTMQSVMCVF